MKRWIGVIGMGAALAASSAQAQFNMPLPISPDCPAGKHWGWIQPGTGKIVNSLAEGGNPGCVPDVPPTPAKIPDVTQPNSDKHDLFAACISSIQNWITNKSREGGQYTMLPPRWNGKELGWLTTAPGGYQSGWNFQANLSNSTTQQNGNYVFVGNPFFGPNQRPRPMVLAGLSVQGIGGSFGVGYLYCDVDPATGVAGAVNADWQRGCYRNGGAPGTGSGCGH